MTSLLLVDEVAAMLRRDEATIRRMIRRGELDAYKPGGNVYLIPSASVHACLDASRVTPATPPRPRPVDRPRPASAPRGSFRERAKQARNSERP